MKKVIYLGILVLSCLSLPACETQSERAEDPNKDAAHKRNHRADYAEETQGSH